MKLNASTLNGHLFRERDSHSPEEILAAGGATAFGKKAEKNNEKLIAALQNSPPIEPFTPDEWNELMAQLDATK